MTSLLTRQLLFRVAQNYQHQLTTFSRQEIIQKINEIKYLSAQKKVPRLSLRKEILHLENKLQSVFLLERRLQEQKKHEAKKIANYKRQITLLNKKLAVTEDHHLRRKVEKLSHLLGENLAQKEIRQDVQKKSAKSTVAPSSSLSEGSSSSPLLTDPLTSLLQRLQMIKHQLQQQQTEVDNEKINVLTAKIKTIEQKIQSLKTSPPLPSAGAAPQTSSGSRHVLIFGSPLPKDIDQSAEKELPLPPPPRFRRR